MPCQNFFGEIIGQLELWSSSRQNKTEEICNVKSTNQNKDKSNMTINSQGHKKPQQLNPNEKEKSSIHCEIW